MKARRVKINYRKVDPWQLEKWLEANNYKYALIPSDDSESGVIGTLTLFVEVYSEEAETALRLKWNVE